MPDRPELTFDDLVAFRQQLQTLCRAHYDSLIKFAGETAFKLHIDEDNVKSDSHLSSTATCIESLLDCSETFLPHGQNNAVRKNILQRAKAFARAAIERKNWQSEGSAKIYCRCRTLPLVIRYIPEFRPQISRHLNEILFQLNDSSRLAIGEAFSKDESDDWYPPNAYHTYWTLYILDKFSQYFFEQYTRFDARITKKGLSLGRIHQVMLAWARQVAGNQIALHSSESSTLDSDQLAWSLAILLRFDHSFQSDLSKQNFITYGLKCLFDHQTSDGNWRTGGPLFHYKNAGNAYCYVFETFTILLKSALTKRQEGDFLRKVLSPYAGNLLKLWRYATLTQIQLSGASEVFLWSSGHRPNRKEAESWATASVYSFSQSLRRLFGIWTREAAAIQLKANTPRQSSEQAISQLSKRGETWTKTKDVHSAATQLMALYVNPVRFLKSQCRLEPDSQPIAPDQARAAILFGPPGTSKTTLAQNVASAIGWNYVELHASHFVSDGLPNVQRTADKIFGELMQLDRTVILFDEIDELVRAREHDSDAFGRFLTTSMLPRLAELWKGRKVIYFVATNHIKFFDPAIRRAERFDTLIDVSPPSFKIKMDRLRELLEQNFETELTSSQVEKMLTMACEATRKGPEEKLPPEFNLAKFLLVRWDQLHELASLIKKKSEDPNRVNLTTELLTSALSEFSEPSLMTYEPFIDYLESRRYQQYDFSRVNVWAIRGAVPESSKKQLEPRGRDGEHEYWYESRTGFADFGKLPDICEIVDPGFISFSSAALSSTP